MIRNEFKAVVSMGIGVSLSSRVEVENNIDIEV
jgi:hypothetical protein